MTREQARSFILLLWSRLIESNAILDHLRIRLLREEFKRIEMMPGSVNKAIGVYGVTIDSLEGNFRLETEVTKVDRGSLLSLENPKYAEVIQKYLHLTGIQMTDRDDSPNFQFTLYWAWATMPQ